MKSDAIIAASFAGLAIPFLLAISGCRIPQTTPESVSRTSSAALNGASVKAPHEVRELTDSASRREIEQQAFRDYLMSTGIEGLLDARVKQVRELCDIAELQDWAVSLIQGSSLQTGSGDAREGIASEVLYAPLKAMADPIGAAIVRRGNDEPRVEVVWRGPDTFWGVTVGSPTLEFPYGPRTLVRQIRPGVFVWHTH